MAINASVSNCNIPLIDNIITKSDGFKVQVSECPPVKEDKVNKLLCGWNDLYELRAQ